MKRFILFAYQLSNPSGGTNDIYGSYDTFEEIVLHKLEPPMFVGIYIAQILDTQTGTIKKLKSENKSTWTEFK